MEIMNGDKMLGTTRWHPSGEKLVLCTELNEDDEEFLVANGFELTENNIWIRK